MYTEDACARLLQRKFGYKKLVETGGSFSATANLMPRSYGAAQTDNRHNITVEHGSKTVHRVIKGRFFHKTAAIDLPQVLRASSL